MTPSRWPASLQSGTAERAAVTLAYGRVLLAQNDKRGFTEYRKNLRKLKLKGSDASLVEVYDAWAQAITKPTEADTAVKTLKEILGKNENCDATVRGGGRACPIVSGPRRYGRRKTRGGGGPQTVLGVSTTKNGLH